VSLKFHGGASWLYNLFAGTPYGADAGAELYLPVPGHLRSDLQRFLISTLVYTVIRYLTEILPSFSGFKSSCTLTVEVKPDCALPGSFESSIKSSAESSFSSALDQTDAVLNPILATQVPSVVRCSTASLGHRAPLQHSVVQYSSTRYTPGPVRYAVVNGSMIRGWQYNAIVAVYVTASGLMAPSLLSELDDATAVVVWGFEVEGEWILC
jgi:hypothetical protein